MEEKPPISTPLTPNSSQIRRRLATSRTGTIISRLFKSRYTELYVVVFGALTVMAFWGSTAEGQASLLNSWTGEHLQEVLAFDFRSPVSGIQMADINSFTAGSGSGGDLTTIQPTPSLPPLLQDSALLAVTAPDNEYLDQLATQRSDVSEYTVQEGDLISFIASDFGVSVNSIIWANGLKDVDSISLGQVLRIPPVSGVIHKVAKGDTAVALAKKYGVEADRIVAYNRLPQDGALEAGEEIIVPDGRMPGVVSVTMAGTTVATSKTKAAAQFGHLPDLGSYFKIPTTGRDWGIIHGRNGVDIANSCGTPVYAAADGKVTVADADGYNGGFGKYIKISHANGTETLYAHSMKLLVAPGQVVGKGDKIMLMGTTGRSTGCHLHFEVHGAHNPLAKS